MRAGAGLVAHGVGEGPHARGVDAHGLPCAPDAGVVHVAHPPVPGLPLQPVGGLGQPGGPQLGPPRGIVRAAGLGAGLVGGVQGPHGAAAEHPAAEFGPAAQPPEADDQDGGDDGVPDVRGHDGGQCPGPGVGREHVERPEPEPAEVAVPQQRPQQQPRQQGDQGPADQLAGGGLLGFLGGPRHVPVRPHARPVGGAREAQPVPQGRPGPCGAWDGRGGRPGAAGRPVSGCARCGAGASRACRRCP